MMFWTSYRFSIYTCSVENREIREGNIEDIAQISAKVLRVRAPKAIRLVPK